MNIPFTTEEFLSVFQLYNQAIWPGHILGYLLGIGALWAVFKPGKRSHLVSTGILGILWIWMGAVYHLGYFAAINPAARLFGVLFILQGLLFFVAGFRGDGLTYQWRNTWSHYLGLVFIVYALILYPLLGTLAGHGWPHLPLFGVAPCPTTIFTFGLLLFTSRLKRFVLIIPLLWSIVGLSAAIHLGIVEDFAMIIAGLTTTGILFFRSTPTLAPAA